ncbi:hypothetical protein HK18_06230 [Commensalibacter intestini]|uniref:Uncharacterized protein n=1 Tax=Commensalibacter intestini TaxID=479936 RepID=A0A251ZWC2_9PROT|nr:hypothetical protein [Commensalibacter intestini]OUI78977.1 hypothetical protein HK18_06230 [Commensalibacter intestini]
MKHYQRLKNSFWIIACIAVGSGNALAEESSSFEEIPKSCQSIPLEQLTFELPFVVQKLSFVEQQKIRKILDGARTQACILQMQYDSLIQQVIATLFENDSTSEEQLKLFTDQLVSLTQNRIDNRIVTVSSIQKIVSVKEWQALLLAYTQSIIVKNAFEKQQSELQRSYDLLIDGNAQSELSTTALMHRSVCVEMHPKMKTVEQLFSKLSLTNTQEGQIRSLMRLEERNSCAARQGIRNLSEQLLKMLPISSDSIKDKQYQSLLKQLITNEYIIENSQIKTISSLFQLLTVEQKTRLKERYMLVKGVL